jgi:hypothetical protein
MNSILLNKIIFIIGIIGAAIAVNGCATTPSQCALPAERNLDRAIAAAQAKLSAGCEAHFDQYMDQLLGVAAGDPRPENKQKFSDFLVWTADEGILSRRQAQKLYNHYFNVKFMALEGDYNNCAHTCPRKSRVLSAMEAELADKERGLLKVSQDAASYYRADQLFQETELVLEATCNACGQP